MTFFESFTLSYLINFLWQVPVIALAAWFIVLLLRRLGASLEHRVWVTALLLSALIPACSLDLFALAHRLGLAHHESHGELVRVVTGPATAIVGFAQHRVFQSALIIYIIVTLYFALRLLLGLVQTARLRRQAQPALLSSTSVTLWQSNLQSFHLPSVPVFESADVAGPVVIGFTRPCLLLPTGWPLSASEEDLAAAFAHECAHLARHDFAKNLAYTFLTLPIAFHPLLRFIRTPLVETREMICDEAAAHAIAGKQQYAKSLLRLASLLATAPRSQPAHAIGIFDANNASSLEKRIMKLTTKSLPISTTRRVASVAVAAALGLGTCAFAVTMHRDVAVPKQDVTPPSIPTADSVSKEKPSIVTGQILKRVDPIYPKSARAKKIQGNVRLRVLVGKDGKPKQLVVVDGPPALQDSALTAVRQWVWKPSMLKGNPTEVKVFVDVTYQVY